MKPPVIKMTRKLWLLVFGLVLLGVVILLFNPVEEAPKFGLNDENNVCVYDHDFSAQLEKIFTDDLVACSRVTLDEWRERGVISKIREMIASLLRDQV